jgi:trans-2,3-dihydro-3-hydroxyanthranilate isomerase
VLLGRIDGGTQARAFVLELGIGPVRCQVTPLGTEHGRAVFDLPRLPASVGAPADDEVIAAALGIDATDIGLDGMKPARWSAGAPYTMVPVRGLEAIKRCRVDHEHWDKAFGFDAHAAAYMFCRGTAAPEDGFHTRMFAPRQGVPEDPATGSAAAAFAGYLAAHGEYPDGERVVHIEQGYEMGRPSILTLGMTLEGGRLAAAAISGDAVVVTEGIIEA